MSDRDALDAAMEDVPWEHDHTTVDGVDLHFVVAGPDDGDLVLLLHGFPECWYTWRHQLPALADAGYRVVALDMRGANRSAKPAATSAYSLPRLAADAAGVVRAFDRDSAHVVGHDFGGLVGWHLAHDQPDVIDRLAILNCPHLSVYGRRVFTSLSQLRKSWYVLYFQLPRLPEWGLAWDDYAVLDSLYRDNVDPEAITDDDVARFTQAFAREGTAHAMLDWYRALFRWYWREIARNRGVPAMPIRVPTLLVWGEADHALDAAMVDDHEEWVEDLRIDRFPDAGHWVHWDERERVTDALRSFLS